MKEVIIDSGIPYGQMKNYFDEVAKPLSPQQYQGEKWEVVLKKIEDQGHKTVPIPRTLVTFKGEDEAVEKAVHNYRMEFLQGGG